VRARTPHRERPVAELPLQLRGGELLSLPRNRSERYRSEAERRQYRARQGVDSASRFHDLWLLTACISARGTSRAGPAGRDR
jgi:hypothetical protein